MTSKKIYKKSSWSWFYKNFIENTVNDNFYTAVEIMSEQRDLIDRVKNFNMDGSDVKDKMEDRKNNNSEGSRV